MVDGMIEFVIPVKTVNEANGSHGHWRVKASRRKHQRKVAACCVHAKVTIDGPPYGYPHLPVVVIMSRMSAGTLDDDNLRVSLKAIRDGIADAFGLPDNDPRIEWRYGQEKCKRGAYGVRVRIEAMPAGFSAKRCAEALDSSSEND